jgi:hypothetical protein
MGWLSDIGDAVSSAASAVGDAVEGAANAVVDGVEDIVDGIADTVQDGIGSATDWLCNHGGVVGCALGNFFGGVLDGIVQGFREILGDYFDIFRDVFGIVGSLLRLDFPGVLEGLGGLFIDILDLGIDFVRLATGGYIVGGIVKKFKRSALIRFVERLVTERFGDDPDRLAEVRSEIGLDGGRFGFRLPAEHRVCVMDSEDVDLWRMHEDGELDLYAMAGVLSFDSFALGSEHPNTVVKSVGADGTDNWWPVTRWTISKYLESNGEAKRLRVYSMSHRVAVERQSLTSRKLDEIGIVLDWNDGEEFDGFRAETTQEIAGTEYDFPSGQIETILGRPEYDRPPGENCSLVALAGFKLDNFGRVAGRNIQECENFPDDCATPGRTDRCCNTIDWRRSSGVIYRDVYPEYVFKYVLAHEIGHYLGLCHCEHDGFQNVMFRPDILEFFDVGLLSFYWDSEPHFSLKDGKNAWRFIIDQLLPCLIDEEEVSMSAEMESRTISARNSCAVVNEPAERSDERREGPRVR